MNTSKTFVLAAVCVAFSQSVRAQVSTNKWDYDLLHPVPTDLMRGFETDRPSKTDVPFTVDAGHFQLETDFINYTRDDDAGVRKTVIEAAPNMNFKVGILNNTEAQLILGNYVHAEYTGLPGNQRIINQGFGDITARVKVNLFGNDSGTFALALLPYVKLPTDTGGVGNHSYEGGINAPFAANLPWNFTLNAETGVGVFRNDDDGGYHAAFNNSVILYHPIYGKFSAYGEFFSSVSQRASDAWIGTADFGVIYQMTKNIAWDVNTAIGLTRAADDFNVFCGIGIRL